MSKKLDALRAREAKAEQKLKAIQKEKQLAINSESERRRKEENRLKVLVGAAFLARFDSNKIFQLLDNYFDKANDRKVFIDADGNPSEIFKSSAKVAPPSRGQGLE